MKKKIISVFIALVFLLNISAPVFADTSAAVTSTSDTVLTDPSTPDTAVTGTSTDTAVTDSDDSSSPEADVELNDAGILPDSTFYFLDKLVEKIILIFTFSPEKKAQVMLEYANERLAEADAEADKGDQDLANQTVQVYIDTLEAAQVQLTIAFDSNTTSGTVYNSVYSVVYGKKSQTVAAVVYGLDISQRKAAQVLLRVLAKAPEQARKGLLNAFANVVKKQLDQPTTITAIIDGKTVTYTVYGDNRRKNKEHADQDRDNKKLEKNKDQDKDQGKEQDKDQNERGKSKAPGQLKINQPVMEQRKDKQGENKAAGRNEHSQKTQEEHEEDDD